MNKEILEYVIRRQQTIGEKTFDKNMLLNKRKVHIDIKNSKRSQENAENYKRSDHK